jgi:hypothetical protein
MIFFFCSTDYTAGGSAGSVVQRESCSISCRSFFSWEKTVWHAVEQALQNSNDDKAELTQELESTKASLTATHDKLTSKSTALDVAVIQEQQARIQMMMAEEKLKAAKEKLKT